MDPQIIPQKFIDEDPKKPWLKGLIWGETNGGYVCTHGKQLTLCPECCLEAERRMRDSFSRGEV